MFPVNDARATRSPPALETASSSPLDASPNELDGTVHTRDIDGGAAGADAGSEIRPGLLSDRRHAREGDADAAVDTAGVEVGVEVVGERELHAPVDAAHADPPLAEASDAEVQAPVDARNVR